MRLQGKVAFVSGGARGLGEADVRIFVREGASVGFGDILHAEGRALEAELTAAGARVLYVPLDVTSQEQWRAAIQATVQAFGPLNVLVNNAAMGGPGTIEDTTRDFWDRVMAVNSTGVFLGAAAAVPEMRKAGGGSIINISSQMGIVASTTSNASYQTSKGAVRMFTKTTAVQHTQDGIRANSVHPGPIATRMGDSPEPSDEQQRVVTSKVPLARYGRPEEIAAGILFLASDEASYVTGAELVIDGGWTAW